MYSLIMVAACTKKVSHPSMLKPSVLVWLYINFIVLHPKPKLLRLQHRSARPVDRHHQQKKTLISASANQTHLPVTNGYLLHIRFGLRQDTLEKLHQYALLLTQYNQHVNLISRQDIHNLWPKHIYPCLSLLHFPLSPAAATLLQHSQPLRHTAGAPIQYQRHSPYFLADALGGTHMPHLHNNGPTANVLDIGTGGGLPGLVLAMCCPNSLFHLIDARRRKIDALQAFIKELGLRNVMLSHSRAETLKTLRGSFDIVLGRAVTPLSYFLPLAAPFLTKRSPNRMHGIFYMRGGDIAGDLNKTGIPPDACVICKSHQLFPDYTGDKKVLYVPYREIRKAFLTTYGCM